MNKKNTKFLRTLFSILFSISLLSCASGFLKYKGEKDIFKNSDFEQKVQIKPEIAVENKVGSQVNKKSEKKENSPVKAKIDTIKKSSKSNKLKITDQAVLLRQPEIEDNEGFDGNSRRPIMDPFTENETVIHSVSYFSAEAGKLTLKVMPFVEVNGRKSYNYLTDLKTSGIFSNFYSVDDQVETYVDFQDLTPHVFKLHIKESGQLREGQSYFDNKTLKASYWEHKYTEKKGHEEKKQDWDILPFSQNAFSGIFYMRIFKWDIGKEYSFRVADDQKNIIFKGTALRKEKLSTSAGEFDAIQIKVQIASRGALEQAGDMYFWISDDEHKYVLRIEAKIKIGTLVSEVIEIKPGQKK